MIDAFVPALKLYRLGKLVPSSLDLDTTLDAIIDATHELIGTESTAILLQEDAEHLVIRVGRERAASSVGQSVTGLSPATIDTRARGDTGRR